MHGSQSHPAIARDGARSVEVAVRLQKALRALACLDDPAMRAVGTYHSRLALARAERAMHMNEDLLAVRQAARFSANAA